MRLRVSLFISLSAVLFSLLFSAPVRADGMDNFTYQCNGNTFTWQLPASSTFAPDHFFTGLGFEYVDVSVSENGGTPILGFMTYFSSLSGGLDFYIYNGHNSYFINNGGDQLYVGSEDNPTFLLGTFSLSDCAYSDSDEGLPGRLTISSAVPEPGTLLLLSLASALAILTYLLFFKTRVIRPQ